MIKGILFDLDNTLLQSRIDFFAMKKELYEKLLDKSIFEPFDWKHNTPSQIIELARNKGIDPETEAMIWETVTRFEEEGMRDAALSPGVPEMLQFLSQQGIVLTVVTNNAHSAAVKALKETGIVSFFDRIAGREQMKALKPSPSGIEYILAGYPDIRRSEWLYVGDSWIDGRASELAGISFVAFCACEKTLKQKGVEPVARITQFSDLPDILAAL
ncbi:MAG: HAD family hydrolase [Bacillaceae bacterium]|nr:HAD family hydrolase [Bacillaceae bacterium]